MANIVFIMLLGILLLASAGAGVAEKLKLPSYYFFKKQLVFLVLGMGIILFLISLSEKSIRRIVLLGFISTTALLVLVIFFGDATKGAKRWLNVFGFSLQPSEFLKPFYTCFLAIILSHANAKVNLKTFSICIFFNIIVAGLLLLQPDFGMTVVNTMATFALLFIAGIKLSWVLVMFVFFICSVYVAYLCFPHVASRVNKFINPVDSSNYQVQKSLSSYLDGGLFGKGPGEGTIKYNLPDAHTDFIFAVGAEEFGVIFCLLIMLTFAIFILRGFWGLTKLTNLFHIYASFGILLHFAMQFLFNIGVTLNLFPTKGMTLPFISYGGSSMIAFSIAAGIYLNLSSKKHVANSVVAKKFVFIQDKY
ncbi:FtsW/RodA/SpoVE family cell cycle protein [Candidatus Bandiella euplotis]|uniref:FtsW/RodA/SpoVE family cell cycle protein n=1 Tax=Candidatus Bandiella euplotis TaxID=1664265 RepID=UPI002B259A00|nr:putative peptidoglycan glycosyltransferase FtsW [Candidatus Bandiella woodruffii]